MFNNIHDREKGTHEFNGFFRGEVLKNDDPKKAGRVKIHVFGVYDNMPVEHLPWAILADPMMGGLKDNGGIFVPEVGSHVFVFFEQGDHEKPVYFAGAPAIQDGEPDTPSESREEGEYPYNKVFKTKAGISFEIDDTEDAIRFKFKHPSGNQMEIDNDGNKSETIVGDSEKNIEGDKTETVSGDVTESIEGDKTIDSDSDITITANGDGTFSVSGGITINADGSVSISGSDVSISGDSAVSIDGGAQVTIEGAIVNIN